jgi:polyisoprenoid-binding protein YceI
MSVRRWILLAVLVSAAVPTLAADRYTLDPNHTYPSLEFSHMGLSIWRGKFNRTSGTVTLDRSAKNGTVEVQVDIGSIDFGHDKMNQFALTADWLNVEKFPTMTYQGVLVFDGDTPASVYGNLTLLGATRPVTLRINSFKCMTHPLFKREVCGADAEGELNRADFGLSKYTEMDGGKIHLRIQVEALKDE